MYQKILVPLDGSKFAEGSLKHAQAFARESVSSEVILFMAREPIPSYALVMADQEPKDVEKSTKKWIQRYLDDVAAGLKKEGIAVKTVMTKGNAAAKILSYASKNKVDLIVMSTHGESGVVHWMLGSTTYRVMRHASAPVLVISPHEVHMARKGK